VQEKILVIGEVLIDEIHTVNGNIEKLVGGSPFNIAMTISKLGLAVDLATFYNPNDDNGEMIFEKVKTLPNLKIIEGSDQAMETTVATANVGENGSSSYEF